MQISKAVITAAGKDQSHLPLQTVVDQSGNSRNALELVLDEIASAGIDEVAIVVGPGQTERYQAAAGPYADRLTFFQQAQPRGYGDALLQAKAFVENQAFLHLVSDHLYVSHGTQSCAAQLVEVARREACCVSAIQATRENKLMYFGAVGGSPVPRQSHLYEVNLVLEKPTPTMAEQLLIVAGQRSGYYLCLFGMHVLTPLVMNLLEQAVADTLGENSAAESADDKKVNLSDSLNRLAQSERYLAFQVNGERYNIGEKYGLLIAQMAIALSGPDRDRILVETIELLARR